MRRLSARPGKEFDERWMCAAAFDELFVEDKKVHEGKIYDAMFVLRSEINDKRIKEQVALLIARASEIRDAANQAASRETPRCSSGGAWGSCRDADNHVCAACDKVQKNREEAERLSREAGAAKQAADRLPISTPALPGDFVVDRAMRTAYFVAPDGSRRRVDDDVNKTAILDKLKELKEKV